MANLLPMAVVVQPCDPSTWAEAAKESNSGPAWATQKRLSQKQVRRNGFAVVNRVKQVGQRGKVLLAICVFPSPLVTISQL